MKNPLLSAQNRDHNKGEVFITLKSSQDVMNAFTWAATDIALRHLLDVVRLTVVYERTWLPILPYCPVDLGTRDSTGHGPLHLSAHDRCEVIRSVQVHSA